MVCRSLVCVASCVALLTVACSTKKQAPKDASKPKTAQRVDAGTKEEWPFMGPPPPPKRLFARKYVVKIRAAPRKSAQRIGYMRGGSVLMGMTGHPVGFEKCRKGWYELETGGFVCTTVDITPFYGKRLPERRALQPDRNARLPYPYGYSRRANTPVYRRLPTDEEAAIYEGYQIPGMPPPDAGVASIQAPQIAGAPGSGSEDDVAEEGDPVVPTLESLMGDKDSVLMRRMERGFYVSLDREMRRGARRYYRTQSNGFIPSKGLFMVKGSEFHGAALTPPGATSLMDAGVAAQTPQSPAAEAPLDTSVRLPIAFVMSSKTTAFKINKQGRLTGGGKPGYHHMFPVRDRVEIRGRTYLVGPDGRHYREDDVRRIDAIQPPKEVGSSEKWIDVDLTAQSLVLYEGPNPVYATLISSGRVRDEDDPLKNFASPTGSFRITSKHLTATMDGDHALDGPYSIEDVPYVMYFQLAYALHSAFWHNSFGRPRSHGCINLAPDDARHVFNWATPELPKGWHGVYPLEDQGDDKLGTRLYIRGEAPKG